MHVVSIIILLTYIGIPIFALLINQEYNLLQTDLIYNFKHNVLFEVKISFTEIEPFSS